LATEGKTNMGAEGCKSGSACYKNLLTRASAKKEVGGLKSREKTPACGPRGSKEILLGTI